MSSSRTQLLTRAQDGLFLHYRLAQTEFRETGTFPAFEEADVAHLENGGHKPFRLITVSVEEAEPMLRSLFGDLASAERD